MIKVLPIVSGKQSRVLTVSSTKILSPTVGRVSGGESWDGGPAEGREEVEVEEWGEWSSILVEQSGREASSVEEEGAEGGGGTGGAEYGFGVMCGRGTGLGVLGLGPEWSLCWEVAPGYGAGSSWEGCEYSVRCLCEAGV